jgi:hypothetical protein
MLGVFGLGHSLLSEALREQALSLGFLQLLRGLGLQALGMLKAPLRFGQFATQIVQFSLRFGGSVLSRPAEPKRLLQLVAFNCE